MENPPGGSKAPKWAPKSKRGSEEQTGAPKSKLGFEEQRGSKKPKGQVTKQQSWQRRGWHWVHEAQMHNWGTRRGH